MGIIGCILIHVVVFVVWFIRQDGFDRCRKDERKFVLDSQIPWEELVRERQIRHELNMMKITRKLVEAKKNHGVYYVEAHGIWTAENDLLIYDSGQIWVY